MSAAAVSSVTGCGESFLIFHVSAVGAMIVPSAFTRHGTDVGTLISMLSSGKVCAVLALSACACGGGYQYCCSREGDECRDEACRRARCRSVSHFSCCLLFHLVECRFFSSHRAVMSFLRWLFVSCCIRLCCMALCRLGDTGCRIFRSASSYFISSRLIASSHPDTFGDTLRSIREAGREIGCHSIIHMRGSFKQFRIVSQSGVDMEEYPSCLVFRIS